MTFVKSNQKGFTLTELLVGMVVTAVFFSIVGLLVVSITQTSKNTRLATERNSEVTQIVNVIDDEINEYNLDQIATLPTISLAGESVIINNNPDNAITTEHVTGIEFSHTVGSGIATLTISLDEGTFEKIYRIVGN